MSRSVLAPFCNLYRVVMPAPPDLPESMLFSTSSWKKPANVSDIENRHFSWDVYWRQKNVLHAT